MDNYYVYIYLDPRKHGYYKYGEYKFDYEPFYVGKGKDNRYKNIKWGRNRLFKNKINKIKRLGFESIIFKLYKNLNENQSFEIETKLISEIKKINSKILTNITSGGEGSSGYKHSEKMKISMSKSRKKNFFIIENEFEKRNYILLTTEKEYIDNKNKLKYICPQNHEGTICWNNFQRNRNCPVCERKLKSEKQKGEKGTNSILITQDIIQIKLLLKNKKLTQQEIGDIFGVGQLTISNIKTEKTWSHIKL